MGKPPKPAPKMTSPKTGKNVCTCYRCDLYQLAVGTKKASIESSEVLNEPVEHGLK